MPDLELAIKRTVPTIAAAIKSLAAMERQLDTAKTYQDIRRIVAEATAIKLLFKHVAEVKAQAEDAVLLGNRRIAEELRKVPKAKGGGQLGKNGFSLRGKSTEGRGATGIKPTSRHRLGKLVNISRDDLRAAAGRLRKQGKDATVSAVVREITQGDKRKRRTERERELGKKIVALPGRRYGVIVADPEWQFEPWSYKTGMDRAAANHYPTSILPVIAARDVPSISARDCILFLWATIPMLPHALTVMAAWKFDYKSHYAWGKDKLGTGYWNREKHELLLIGVRGQVPCPAPGDQWESLIMAPRGKHSAKPEKFLKMIESYFPNVPKIELNRRGSPRSGWDAWGQEAREAAE